MPRRSYDHFCAAARALDVIGDRWALLIVRELLAGPRRYTDLHADLPGISTDMLAARLKDLEQDAVLTRRKLPPPGAATVYTLTPRGHSLLPVLTALSIWGAPELTPRRPTDAMRAHWFALPLTERLRRHARGHAGVVEVRLDEGTFHFHLPAPPSDGGAAAPDNSDPRLTTARHADATADRLDLQQPTTSHADGPDLQQTTTSHADGPGLQQPTSHSDVAAHGPDHGPTRTSHRDGAPDGRHHGPTGYRDGAADGRDPRLTTTSYADGAADKPDLRLTMTSETCLALVQGTITPAEAYRAGKLTITGTGPLADALTGKEPAPPTASHPVLQ
ncbi:transcriptional regulator [Nonomuraea sp. FMUSA5-5]|uniref:Transcriptional regulator n=1 Tax=Nonomuraea composti TaxID=2720023 RepID=A0ABX1BPP5_9ACTN|nr:winged helix-turn-helix transcriptional regulator [Nonomuraea sp. FMUSA5-5]NJP97756.1 transcriptional regulator [Nonomuraea sp. FMUSA5-5]